MLLVLFVLMVRRHPNGGGTGAWQPSILTFVYGLRGLKGLYDKQTLSGLTAGKAGKKRPKRPMITQPRATPWVLYSTPK